MPKARWAAGSIHCCTALDSYDDEKHAPVCTYESRKPGVAGGAKEGWRGKTPASVYGDL